MPSDQLCNLFFKFAAANFLVTSFVLKPKQEYLFTHVLLLHALFLLYGNLQWQHSDKLTQNRQDYRFHVYNPFYNLHCGII